MENKHLFVDPLPFITPSKLLISGPPSQPQQTLFTDSTAALRFVIKRHRASSLHTDFRLEAYDELISWAFWKHPSLDPKRKLLAKQMGDHQLQFWDSERRIPDGLYGAGPLVVWDFGFYRPLIRTSSSDEHQVVEDLQRGSLDFWMEGKRLKGGFRLRIGPKGWELSKLSDEYAAIEPFEWDDLSVLSGKSLDDIEREYQASLRRLRG